MKYCSDCGEELVKASVEEKERPETGMVLKAVYKAPDEFSALTIKSLLESEGIEAEIKSYQIAAYDSVGMMQKPFWGEVIVLEKDYQKSLKIIEEYLNYTDFPCSGE